MLMGLRLWPLIRVVSNALQNGLLWPAAQQSHLWPSKFLGAFLGFVAYGKSWKLYVRCKILFLPLSNVTFWMGLTQGIWPWPRLLVKSFWSWNAFHYITFFFPLCSTLQCPRKNSLVHQVHGGWVQTLKAGRKFKCNTFSWNQGYMKHVFCCGLQGNRKGNRQICNQILEGNFGIWNWVWMVW